MDRTSRVPTSRPFAAGQLSLLWLGWLLLVIFVLAAWTPRLFPYFDDLARPGPEADEALREASITAPVHAGYHVALDLAFGTVAIVLGALILRRNRGDELAVSAAFVLTVWGPMNGLIVESMGTGAVWARGLAVLSWGSWAWLLARSFRLSRSAPPLNLRQRIHWLWYGSATSLFAIVVVTASIGTGVTLDSDQIDRHMTGHLLLVLGGGLLPAALGAAWLLPAIPDPDTLIRRTLVYAALASIALALTIGFVVLPALLYFELGIVYFLALVCAWAVLGIPLQQLLQRTVNRLLFGQRDEPTAVLNDLGSRLELGSPETVLTSMVETVARTLKLPAVAIRADNDEDLAFVGHSTLEPVSIPIVHQSQQVGQLIVSPRARDEPLHEKDHEILRLIARQAGPTVHAVQLNQELRRSRQQILSGREEERRRIRRDLHDGLGPALAAIAMQADTARAVVDDDPAAARELLEAVTRQAEDVVHEVRRLVYDLRPPALDELGLIGAIARLGRQQSSATLRVDVSGPAALSELAAAVEVAVYRVVAEALTNVVRHSGASHCAIAILIADQGSQPKLLATIEDDGLGIDEAAASGIGLRSMRERASEVGGAITVGRRPQGGTAVALTVPLGGLPYVREREEPAP